MLPIPADIFTEPDNVSPDGLANLGPLRHLAGVWQADKGVDVNPKAEGPERRIFREHIRMDPIDPQANGPQLFYGLRYHIHINTPEEDITFHDQVGYWLWEPATGLILQSVTIPRARFCSRRVTRSRMTRKSPSRRSVAIRVTESAQRSSWKKLSARRVTDATSPSTTTEAGPI